MFIPAFLNSTKVSGLLVFGPMVQMIEVLLKLAPVSVLKLVNQPNLDSIAYGFFCVSDDVSRV